MKNTSARQCVRRLHELRRRYGPDFAKQKLAILRLIPGLRFVTAIDVKRLHDCLCFLRAFPDDANVHAAVVSRLGAFQQIVQQLSAGQRARLVESGIAGTDLYYPFSYEVAKWISSRFPGTGRIDWDTLADTSRLDEILGQLLEHAEADYFHGGQVSTREWLGIATNEDATSTFDWLMVQLSEREAHASFWAALYDAVDLQLKCTLQNDLFSKTASALPTEKPCYRSEPMQSRVRSARKEIARPLPEIRHVETPEGRRILDVAKSSLALRHRETDHFNNGNPDEVYVAEVGKGVQIAMNGLLPERRDPIECTLGYLVLSNGVPIGYGGASVLFHQANTGVNIFDEYRGSEAAWLWTQVMRVTHHLTGCNRFVANPYQFGEGNSEALKSGAFWFYYRLGYRPVDPEVRKVAREEFRKIEGRRTYRSAIKTLKKLATCDMHLSLPGAVKSQLFDEDWIELSAMLASQALANTGQISRKDAMVDIAERVCAGLELKEMQDWPENERFAFRRYCPIVAPLELETWTAGEKRELASLMRAKGGRFEIDYAQKLRNHLRLFKELRKLCRAAARS